MGKFRRPLSISMIPCQEIHVKTSDVKQSGYQRTHVEGTRPERTRPPLVNKDRLTGVVTVGIILVQGRFFTHFNAMIVKKKFRGFVVQLKLVVRQRKKLR